MKKLATLAMAASVFMMPFAANASPSDGVYEGVVTVHKGLTLDCKLTAEVTDGATKVDLGIGPGEFLCSLVSIISPTSDIVPAAGPNEYTIKDVTVATITPGNCHGDIDVLYVASPESIVVNGVLPPDCTVDGTLTKK